MDRQVQKTIRDFFLLIPGSVTVGKCMHKFMATFYLVPNAFIGFSSVFYESEAKEVCAIGIGELIVLEHG